MKPLLKSISRIVYVPVAFGLLLLAGLGYESWRVDHPPLGDLGNRMRPFGPDLCLDLRVGEVDTGGQLMFWRLGDRLDGIPFFLKAGDAYGVILINAGDEERPVARYILASQASRKILDTRNFPQFRQELHKIPKGSVLGIYGTCSVGLYSGLSDGVLEAFRSSIRQAGLKVDLENWRGVCYCSEGEWAVGR